MEHSEISRHSKWISWASRLTPASVRSAPQVKLPQLTDLGKFFSTAVRDLRIEEEQELKILKADQMLDPSVSDWTFAEA